MLNNPRAPRPRSEASPFASPVSSFSSSRSYAAPPAVPRVTPGAFFALARSRIEQRAASSVYGRDASFLLGVSASAAEEEEDMDDNDDVDHEDDDASRSSASMNTVSSSTSRLPVRRLGAAVALPPADSFLAAAAAASRDRLRPPCLVMPPPASSAAFSDDGSYLSSLHLTTAQPRRFPRQDSIILDNIAHQSTYRPSTVTNVGARRTHKCVCMSSRVRDRLVRLQAQNAALEKALRKAAKAQARHKSKATNARRDLRNAAQTARHTLLANREFRVSELVLRALRREQRRGWNAWRDHTRRRRTQESSATRLALCVEQALRQRPLARALLHIRMFARAHRDADEEVMQEALDDAEAEIERLRAQLAQAQRDNVQAQSMLRTVVNTARERRSEEATAALKRLCRSSLQGAQRQILHEWRRQTRILTRCILATRAWQKITLGRAIAAWRKLAGNQKRRRVLQEASWRRARLLILFHAREFRAGQSHAVARAWSKWHNIAAIVNLQRLALQACGRATRRRELARGWAGMAARVRSVQILRGHVRRLATVRCRLALQHALRVWSRVHQIASTISATVARRAIGRLGWSFREWRKFMVVQRRHRALLARHARTSWRLHSGLAVARILAAWRGWAARRSRICRERDFVRISRLESVVGKARLRLEAARESCLRSCLHTWQTQSLLMEGLEAMNDIGGHMRAAGLLRLYIVRTRQHMLFRGWFKWRRTTESVLPVMAMEMAMLARRALFTWLRHARAKKRARWCVLRWHGRDAIVQRRLQRGWTKLGEAARLHHGQAVAQLRSCLNQRVFRGLKAHVSSAWRTWRAMYQQEVRQERNRHIVLQHSGRRQRQSASRILRHWYRLAVVHAEHRRSRLMRLVRRWRACQLARGFRA